MSYYDQIDPIGEEKQNECVFCMNPTNNKMYCSKQCKEEDLK